jgi:hypothetical protein
MARDDGADRDHVIRIAGVPHTEHEPDPDYRKQSGQVLLRAKLQAQPKSQLQLSI